MRDKVAALSTGRLETFPPQEYKRYFNSLPTIQGGSS
jgi:hypothetical protein